MNSGEYLQLEKPLQSVRRALKTLEVFREEYCQTDSLFWRFTNSSISGDLTDYFDFLENNMEGKLDFSPILLNWQTGNLNSLLKTMDMIIAPYYSGYDFTKCKNLHVFKDITDQYSSSTLKKLNSFQNRDYKSALLKNKESPNKKPILALVDSPNPKDEADAPRGFNLYSRIIIDELIRDRFVLWESEPDTIYSVNSIAILPWLDKPIQELEPLQISKMWRSLAWYCDHLEKDKNSKKFRIYILIFSESPFLSMLDRFCNDIKYLKQIKNKGVREYVFRLVTSTNDKISIFSPKSIELFERADRLAGNDKTILILGETGAGKDVIAKHIHAMSTRRKMPFKAVNCSRLLSDHLFESKLFGHKKGSFSGAETQKGYATIAGSGTLFLNEIGELSLESQAKLLDFIENRKYLPIGYEQELDLKARIVTATNKDLRREVDEGRFREDLYYRLNRNKLVVPPLRERNEDIPFLVEYFTERECRNTGTEPAIWDESVLNIFKNYNWPGNIRELENFVEEIVSEVEEDIILPRHILPYAEGNLRNILLGNPENRPLNKLYELSEEEFKHQLFSVYGGNASAMARGYGLKPQAMQRYKENYGLVKKRGKEI